MPDGILLVGHSHLGALAGGRRTETPQLRALDGREGIFALDGPSPRDEAYFERAADEAAGRKVGLVWEGNEHNAGFLLRVGPEFDFVSRYASRLLEDAQIVTQASLESRFRPAIARLEAGMAGLLAAGPRKLVLVGAPPPKRDGERLRGMMAAEPAFARRAEAMGLRVEDPPITDPFVRLKLWGLLQDLYRAAAQRAGCAFVACPPQTQDDDGFLKEEFWHRDVTHANAAYGRLMLERVIEELGE